MFFCTKEFRYILFGNMDLSLVQRKRFPKDGSLNGPQNGRMVLLPFLGSWELAYGHAGIQWQSLALNPEFLGPPGAVLTLSFSLLLCWEM